MPYHRKSAPKVRNGQVQFKNRWNYSATERWTIHRQRPGPGFRHVVSQADIRRFIEILPDWEHGHHGLEGICLSEADDEIWGRYRYWTNTRTGMIFLPAWPKDIWLTLYGDDIQRCAHVLDRIQAAQEKQEDGTVICRFTMRTAKAFMLLHVFLHEFGHHLDRMGTYNRKCPVRGEDYADSYADQCCDAIFTDYVDRFGNLQQAE